MCAPVSNNPLVMESLCSDPPKAEPHPAATSKSSRTSAPSLLTLTAQQVSEMRLDDPPLIRPGDVLAFEANRGDFILHLYLSNGKMIVTQPLTREEAENTMVMWRKGRARLDYPETVNQYLVAFRLIPLHEHGAGLLFRSIKIYRNGRTMLELERNQAGKRPITPEPPMSYPQDPRVMVATVTMPTLFSPKSETGYLAPHIPAFSTSPMLIQSTGTSAGDPNHFKYAGQELDAESGLYHMGARYYSPTLGRFTSPDPLYVEMHRLSDPQQLNLYTYGRNNPTTFSDRTGLDIALRCQGGQSDCITAKDQLNGREHAQFQTGLDKNNKLTAHVSKDAYAKLGSSEKALYNAINDTKSHASLSVVNGDGNVTFGVHNGAGSNTVDIADTAKLNAPSNAGGLNAGDAVAHEGLQAYISLSNDAQSDNLASQFFPGVNNPLSAFIYNSAGTDATGSLIKGNIADGRGSELIRTTFRTPIPAIDIFTKGPTRATTGVERDVDEVKFVPAPR
jgi:RHS repeat-associated protein